MPVLAVTNQIAILAVITATVDADVIAVVETTIVAEKNAVGGSSGKINAVAIKVATAVIKA